MTISTVDCDNLNNHDGDDYVGIPNRQTEQYIFCILIDRYFMAFGIFPTCT